MQSKLSTDFLFDSNSKQQQNLQINQSFVAADESTFTYLPKRPKSIGLTTPTMNRVSSKNLKGYKRRGLFLCDIDPVAYNSIIDPRPYTCFNCWSGDHRLIECPEPLTDIFCCNCGRRYLKIEECPRCARQFWELDESARQWLSSYISIDNQDGLTDCSEKDWSMYKDDSSDSFCLDTKSSKFRDSKDDFKREDMTECESNSKLTLKTSNRDESGDDDWWDCNKFKDEIVVENIDPIMIKKKKSETEYFTSPSVSGKNKYNEENLKVTDTEADSVVEPQLNEDEMVEENIDPMMIKKRNSETEYFTSPSVSGKNRYNEENLKATDTEADSVVDPQLNSFGESSITTQSDEDDEDYDNIIIDEDEQMEESCVVGDTVRDFLDLLKAAKYLPLQQQHTIVLRFASQCKKKF